MGLHSAIQMLIPRNTNFPIYTCTHMYTPRLLSPNSKLILCLGRKLPNTKPINNVLPFWLSKQPEKVLSGGVSLHAPPSFHRDVNSAVDI